MKRTKMILCALLAMALFLSSGALLAAEPGVYLLFVWGSLDPNTLRGVEIRQKKIEAALEEDRSSYASTAKREGLLNTAGGLASLKPYIKRKITLKGSEATNANIVRACRELSNAAEPNDAVLVYILCHGAAIKGTDGKLRHGLAPIATSAQNLQMNRHGIARGTIMKAIKSKPHRLNLLITDSCSATVKFEPLEEALVTNPKGPVNPYLVSFLLEAEGSLNINSSRPETGWEVGELARGFAPAKWEGVPSDPGERDAYEKYAGTVFTNAFLQLAESTDYIPEKELTPEKFFEKLRKLLDFQYSKVQSYLRETNQVGALSGFMQQSTQTLTRFDDDSVAIPENLDRSNRDNSSGGDSNDYPPGFDF